MLKDCFKFENDDVEILIIKKNELLSDKNIIEIAVDLVESEY